MDQNIRLDHAVFQLTPTRTRCDLVIFTGSKGEKLASGLLEPFLSHLKAAKEQMSKGGYSITLEVPKEMNNNASWFTKGTWERFVRFVSTPEILERVVTIESEISQIKNSIHCNDISAVPNLNAIKQTEGNLVTEANIGKPVVPIKSKDESNGDEAGQGENSKLRLQRVLETRKAVLRKEQGMAYARASAAGFEMDHVDGLISFSEAFGASRLRAACLNFKELCKKKLEAGLWLDELAALEASPQSVLSYTGASGIMLTSESTLSQDSIPKVLSGDSTGTAVPILDQCPSAGNEFSNGKTQVPLSYLNHSPHYMYNFQNPIQPAALYQGYPMPGMQLAPPYHPMYSGNMQWPQYMEDSGNVIARDPEAIRSHNLSSETKANSMNRKGSDTSDSTLGLEDGNDSSSDKNSHKKSSKVVVIRNINYITSRKSDGGKDDTEDESVSEDDLIDGDSLKQKVEDAVDSFEKHRKATQRRHKKKGGPKYPIDGSDKYAENDPIGNTEYVEKNWHDFENLLMRDDSGSIVVERDDSGDTLNSIKQLDLDIRDEQFMAKNSIMETQKQPIMTDSFIVAERDKNNEGHRHLGSLESDTNYCRSVKKNNFADDEFLFPQRVESHGNAQNTLSDYSGESSVQKIERGGDWIIIARPERLLEREETIGLSNFQNDQTSSHGENHLRTEKYEEKCIVDDSFVIPIRSSADEQPDSQWRTDISIEVRPPSVGNPSKGNLNDKIEKASSHEPDDLYMLLDRNCGAESAEASWTPEIDYNLNLPVITVETEASVEDSTPPTCENTKKEVDVETKHSSKGPRPKPIQGSLGKNKSEVISRNGKSSVINRNRVQKSKKDKEEEERKRVEELMIQRQKRIAQRSAPTSSQQMTSKPTKEASKISTLPLKHNKEVSGSTIHETKSLSLHKADIESSTRGPPLTSGMDSKLPYMRKKWSMERSSTVKNILV